MLKQEAEENNGDTESTENQREGSLRNDKLDCF